MKWERKGKEDGRREGGRDGRRKGGKELRRNEFWLILALDWWAAVRGAAQSRTRLSTFPFTFHFPALEKEVATHSSVLAWRIPGTGEPGGLPSLGSHRVRHD